MGLGAVDHERGRIAQPLNLRGHEFVVTGSIGIATHPDHGDTAEALMKNAESARDEAKRLGRNTQKLYRSSMSAGISRSSTIDSNEPWANISSSAAPVAAMSMVAAPAT